MDLDLPVSAPTGTSFYRLARGVAARPFRPYGRAQRIWNLLHSCPVATDWRQLRHAFAAVGAPLEPTGGNVLPWTGPDSIEPALKLAEQLGVERFYKLVEARRGPPRGRGVVPCAARQDPAP